MALVKVKPTSPGRRGMVKVVNADLYKGRPYAGLVEAQSKSAGRNNNGHITTRHIGGGHKQHYVRDDENVAAVENGVGFGRRGTVGRLGQDAALELTGIPFRDNALQGRGNENRTGRRQQLLVGNSLRARKVGQLPADPQYSGRYHHALRRNVAWQGRPNGPYRWCWRCTDGA